MWTNHLLGEVQYISETDLTVDVVVPHWEHVKRRTEAWLSLGLLSARLAV